jgi:hypothetical protein
MCHPILITYLGFFCCSYSTFFVYASLDTTVKAVWNQKCFHCNLFLVSFILI